MKIIVCASSIHVGGRTQMTLSFVHYLSKFERFGFFIFASNKVSKQLDDNNLGENIKIIQVNFGFKDWCLGKSGKLDKLEKEYQS